MGRSSGIEKPILITLATAGPGMNSMEQQHPMKRYWIIC